MNKPIAIHWFRQDLRLSDNPAFYEASKESAVLPVYILDDVILLNLKWVEQVAFGLITL